jgi:acyl-CoA thioesterase
VTFSAASALSRLGDDRYQGNIPPDWDIAGNTNGGFLLAIAARAGALTSGRADPVAITGHFLRPVQPGRVTVETELLRKGRTFSVVRSIMRDDSGKEVLATLGSFTDLGEPIGPERLEASPPEVPEPDRCIPVEPTETFPPPFMKQVELRLHPDDVPFLPGTQKDLPRVRGWFRWRSGEPLDSLGLVVASDAFPPTIFNANLPIAWTPTLELTVHVREKPPAQSWLRCAFTTRFISGGYLEEDGELWDSNDRLVAQSRQLALVPRGT